MEKFDLMSWEVCGFGLGWGDVERSIYVGARDMPGLGCWESLGDVGAGAGLGTVAEVFMRL